MMKANTRLLFAAVTALAFGAATVQAQWVYTDVIDGNYNPQGPGALIGGGAGNPPNTFNAADDSAFNWTVTGDGTAEWRYRDTGPGVPAYDGNSYQGRLSEGDIPIYTMLTGLTANGGYDVRLYMVFPENPSSRYALQISFNGGASWQQAQRFAADGTTELVSWVDNSSGVGAGLSAPSGDTRAYFLLPESLIADASGNARIDIRIPTMMLQGSSVDRGILDGFAIQVPEPTTMALAGLGAAALLIFRRRS